MTRDLRTARTGAVLTFVLAGLMCGSMTVRVPALSDKLGLSEASIGLTLLVWGLGALVAMQSMRVVMTRFGSRSILRVAAPLTAVTLALLAAAPTFPLLLVASTLFGMAFGSVDVAMNAQGSAVERAYGRPLMSGMHAGWCVGAIAAGLLGTAAIAAGLPVTVHLTLIALVSLPVVVLLSRTYLPDPAAPASHDGRATATARRMPPVVYLLGVIAFCAFMVEGTVADWNGLYLRDVLGASEAVAALGYPIFEVGMLAGRLAGDRVRARFGARGMIAASGLATAVTFGVVITAPTTTVALSAMLFVGVAVSTVSPTALSLAGGATANPGPAVAQTGAMGYAGLLLGPVVIGFLADLATLRAGLAIAVVLSVAVAVIARFLPRARTVTTPARAAEPELSMAA
ncbi:fucose permease [Streptosporangium becharense]|uniref:Fucose permease n=1 Tax=Streptosporangium becharense TaxID=1816182 RepID=A0A7W9IJY4_9ACTN|nr:MFS transporter [Streptosporangium becharense]MBB2913914.1 fucose permease [Streptosporangium becharense]MBB5821424.1 fucose permease [Streptosporangium becharense]